MLLSPGIMRLWTTATRLGAFRGFHAVSRPIGRRRRCCWPSTMRRSRCGTWWAPPWRPSWRWTAWAAGRSCCPRSCGAWSRTAVAAAEGALDALSKVAASLPAAVQPACRHCLLCQLPACNLPACKLSAVPIAYLQPACLQPTSTWGPQSKHQVQESLSSPHQARDQGHTLYSILTSSRAHIACWRTRRRWRFACSSGWADTSKPAPQGFPAESRPLMLRHAHTRCWRTRRRWRTACSSWRAARCHTCCPASCRRTRTCACAPSPS